MVSKGKKIKKKSKNKNIVKSFSYAFEGGIFALKNVRNLKIHLLFTLLVIIGGIIFKISSIEWLICLLFIALVISLELVNTAIEETVNLAMPNIHPVAKVAKDVSASAVMVSSFIAFIAGFIIFLPKIIELF